MRGMSESEFAFNLKQCFMSVWIDEISSYGTFPLESMKCGVPCMGTVPRMIPEWMSEDNGLWINNKNEIVDYIADFLQNWLEDNINENLLTQMDSTIEKLPTSESFNQSVINNFEGYLETRLKSFEEQLNKLQTID
jgi:glycosyltransferase involved in cell wall biosynthesis